MRREVGRPQKAWPQTVSHAFARVPVQMGHVSAARVSASMPCTAVLYVVIVHTHTRSVTLPRRFLFFTPHFVCVRE